MLIPLRCASRLAPAIFSKLFFPRVLVPLILYIQPAMAVVPFPGVRVTVAESLIRDLGRDSEWCGIWGLKLNASKTNNMIVSRSRTIGIPSHPH